MKKAAKAVAKDLSRATGRVHKRAIIADADWEPSARDLVWYRQWTVEHMRQVAIADAAGVKPPCVNRALKQVDAWMKSQVIDDIITHRTRQTEALEELASECRKKWVSSGEVEYAEQFRKILADIRKIHGLDKPTQVEVSTEVGGLQRVAGMSRDDAIRSQAAKLLATVGDALNDAALAMGDSEDNGDGASGSVTDD